MVRHPLSSPCLIELRVAPPGSKLGRRVDGWGDPGYGAAVGGGDAAAGIGSDRERELREKKCPLPLIRSATVRIRTSISISL
jgi:hypothetical protein